MHHYQRHIRLIEATASEADPGMGGLGGPTVDQKSGLVTAARCSLPWTEGEAIT